MSIFPDIFGVLGSDEVKVSSLTPGRSPARFYDNSKKKVPGNKGFPKFKKHSAYRCVEEQVDGWLLSGDRREITFRDSLKLEPLKSGVLATCTFITRVSDSTSQKPSTVTFRFPRCMRMLAEEDVKEG